MSDYLKGVLLVCGATLFWSFSGTFVRWVPGVDPWTLNAYRVLGMAIALVLWMGVRHGSEIFGHFRRSEPLALLATAGFFGIGTTLYVLSLQLASIAAVSCIASIAPLFAALLARLWLGERTQGIVFVAIGVALVGVAIVALGEAGASINGLAGSIVAVGVAFCFAGQSVTLRRYHKVEMAPALILGGLGVFAVVFLTVGLAPIASGQIALLMLMGLIQLAIPLVLYMRGARHVPVVPMVLISLADAFLNPFWVFLVHGEVPAPAVYAGGALILGAIALATLRRARPPALAISPRPDVPPSSAVH
jgi:drug/metabolite transporter, DME family